MAAVINTNYLSLVAQNNLNKSQSALGSAIERLSSGLRINSAKDDAAGQAIANRFTANIRGLTQAARNANDGISIAQTTEGALNEINNNLQRIRELSVQAANGTNSDTDKASIQAEITQRLQEITRVADQTQFNGVKVLASDQTLTIQVGANDSETINIDLKQINADTLGLGKLDMTAQVTSESISKLQAAGSLYSEASEPVNVKLSFSGDDTPPAELVAGTDGALYAKVGTTLHAVTYDEDTNTVTYSSTGAAAAVAEVAGATTVTVGGKLISLDTLSTATQVDTAAGTGAAYDVWQGADGVLYAVNAAGSKAWKLDGIDGSIDLDTGKVVLGTASITGTTATAGVTGTAVEVTSGSILSLPGSAEIAYDTDEAFDSLEGNNSLLKDAKGNLFIKNTADDGAVTYYSATAAKDGTVTVGKELVVDPLKAIDSALAQVDNLRSNLGALQNRFESTVANLNNTVNNLSASRSRIEDADYATEVSNMTRAQILQQAGTSVLAQANQVPQTVLSLLR